MEPTIGVITNPNSRKNRGRRDRVARLERILGTRGFVRETRDTEAIGPVVDELRAQGVRYWVTDGGDGSLHWLLNTAADRLGGAAVLPQAVPVCVPTNGGTIDFVARFAGLEGDAEQILRSLVRLAARGAEVPTVEVPTLLLRGRQDDGTRIERVGFAAALAGVGNGFFDQYYAAGSGGGARAIVEVMARGAASFLAAKTPGVSALVPDAWLEVGRSLRAEVPAEVRVGGELLPYRVLTAFNVGAIPINLGGVVKVFDRARDGRLHVMVGELSDLEFISNLPRLFTGRPVRSRALFDQAATQVVAVALERPFRAVLDGEFVPELRELELTPGPRVRVPTLDAKRFR